MSVSNQEEVRRIKQWQKFPYVHDLTCAREGCSGVLDPIHEAAKVVLVCPEGECDYKQKWIPDYFRADVFELHPPKIIAQSKES